MRGNQGFIRNESAAELLELFIISTVTSILSIRSFLYLFGYPQLGIENFHIAHMLWGGFFMLIALLINLAFLGKQSRETAAVIGGVGFGTFIDELGKFITSDNNYFFEPTVALLYFIILSLFFLYRYLDSAKKLTEKEYLLNGLELLEDAIAANLRTRDKSRVKNYLQKASIDKQNHEIIKPLLDIIDTLQPPLAKKQNMLISFFSNLDDLFYNITQKPVFKKILLIFLIVSTIWNLLSAITIFILIIMKFITIKDLILNQNLYMAIGEFLSNLMSTVLATIGLFLLRFSPKQALQYFKTSIIISLLITQFFVFYREQFNALTNLIITLIILLALNQFIAAQKRESGD